MQRARQNTEHQLEIISTAHNTRIRVGEPTCYERTKDMLHAMIYNKYNWNCMMYTLFLSMRISAISFGWTEVSIHEWYNDIMLFLLSNNYLFKRIHWNNMGEDYYNTKYSHTIIPFFLSAVFIFSVSSHNNPTFYITKNSVFLFDTFNTTLFVFIVLYILILQCASWVTICKSRVKKRLTIIHITKYILITSYFLLDRIILALHIKTSVTESIENQYHIHHWFSGLLLLFLTEIKQPYYTYVQYIHYTIYLHGIALYSYDSLLQ